MKWITDISMNFNTDTYMNCNNDTANMEFHTDIDTRKIPEDY